MLVSSSCLASDLPFQIGLAASTVLDFTSGATLDKKRFRETNPFLGQNRAVQATVMSATTATTIYSTRKLYKRGKKKTAIGLLLGATAFHIFGATHNLKLR
jgi:hypothetical protein